MGCLQDQKWHCFRDVKTAEPAWCGALERETRHCTLACDSHRFDCWLGWRSVRAERPTVFVDTVVRAPQRGGVHSWSGGRKQETILIWAFSSVGSWASGYWTVLCQVGKYRVNKADSSRASLWVFFITASGKDVVWTTLLLGRFCGFSCRVFVEGSLHRWVLSVSRITFFFRSVVSDSSCTESSHRAEFVRQKVVGEDILTLDATCTHVVPKWLGHAVLHRSSVTDCVVVKLVSPLNCCCSLISVAPEAHPVAHPLQMMCVSWGSWGSVLRWRRCGAHVESVVDTLQNRKNGAQKKRYCRCCVCGSGKYDCGGRCIPGSHGLCALSCEYVFLTRKTIALCSPVSFVVSALSLCLCDHAKNFFFTKPCCFKRSDCFFVHCLSSSHTSFSLVSFSC